MAKDRKYQKTGARICALVYGAPKVGKSWLGQSTPAPRLVLDAEGGSFFAKRMRNGIRERQRVIEWDPHRDPPPEAGEWDTCIARAIKFETLEKAYSWLDSGKHCFRSVVIDSLTEVQKKCKQSISGDETPSERDWGLLLLRMDHLVRKIRDLRDHPKRPIEAVVLLALADDRKDRKMRPAVQGALSISLPGYVDLEAYLYVATDEEDGTQTRQLLISPFEAKGVKYECGDRTDDLTLHYGMVIADPDIEQMLAVLNEEG